MALVINYDRDSSRPDYLPLPLQGALSEAVAAAQGHADAAAQSAEQASAAAAVAVDEHEAADNPHPQYLTDTDSTFKGKLSRDATATASVPFATQQAPVFELQSRYIDFAAEEKTSVIEFGARANLAMEGSTTAGTKTSVQSGSQNIQVGALNTQSGYGNTQNAYDSTQSGYDNRQSGSSNTQTGVSNTQTGGTNIQSGYSNIQSGYNNTQSGYYNSQAGMLNTQSENFGFQHGKLLNNGGFNHTAMFGQGKTATVGDRAYFALDNGIWLKPVATAPASPENGVIYYNSATHKFRGYANGAWVDLH